VGEERWPYTKGLGSVVIRKPAARYFFDTYRRSRDPRIPGEPLYEQPITAQILEIDPSSGGIIKDGTYLRIRSYNHARSNPTAVIFDHEIMMWLPEQGKLLADEVEERSG
jgi:hypothetical protein